MLWVNQKEIDKDILILNGHFWQKYTSIIHNNASLDEHVNLKFSHIKIHQHIYLQF